MSIRHCWNDTEKGNLKSAERNRSQRHFVHCNHYELALAHSMRPETKPLSNGAMVTVQLNGIFYTTTLQQIFCSV
jgi:hypothetical protein